mmetsp:Transcript_14986/g.31779  ORF Transcript_14986/g.31779 Transcript_14986/m.31779 type:complete len:396 (+) Transcript_14986:81-1268(+)
MATEEDNDDHQLLLESWREEQHGIASKVIIPESTSETIQINERYRFVRNASINSSSSNSSSSLLVGGVDVSFQEEGNDAIAVYVVLRFNNTNKSNNDIPAPPEVVYRSHKWYTLTIPYIPSYLAFREIDPLLELISTQMQSHPEWTPNVIFVDGNGQWHERKAGIATFVGVKTGIPTVGIGKTFYSIDGVMNKNDVHRDIKLGLNSWYANTMVSEEGDNKKKIAGKSSKIITPDDSDDSGTTRRGLLLDSVAVPYHSSNDHDSSPSQEATATTAVDDDEEEVPMDQILTSLHQTTTGLAIPMKGGAHNNNPNETLAYALVGHGGNTPVNKKTNIIGRMGSKNPIYISVGSHISLEDAVSLCSELCIARIPEPVREADLYGRQIVREKQQMMQTAS